MSNGLITKLSKVAAKLLTDAGIRSDLTALGKGSALVAHKNKFLSDYLTEQEAYRTIESFGDTSTPSTTTTTMQLAINSCASAGIMLRAKSPQYTLDVSTQSIAIPSNFKCDLGGAVIKRATGNSTPHDMWINADTVNGNSNIHIRGVTFDGQAQADGLTNASVAHRFCGLRLIKCSGSLRSVSAHRTVNGEIQVEGTRGGIMLDRSVYMDCSDIETNNTLGTGLFITGGLGKLSNFRSKDNSGSGLSGDQPGWWLENLRSDGSGYSGISLNGAKFIASNIYATKAAVGFAGINIGHVGSEATEAILSDLVAEGNLGWGINCTGAPKAKIRRARSTGNTAYDLRVTYSPEVDIEITTAGNVVIRESIGTHYLSLRGSNNSFTILGEGAEVIFTKDSIIQGCPADRSGIQADPGAKITFPGVLRNNAGYGATANSGAISLVGALVYGNGTPWRGLTGGTVTVRGVVFDEYSPTSGTVTFPAGTASAVITNKNIITQAKVSFNPLNSTSRGVGLPAITVLTIGESMTATLGGSTHTSDAIFTYSLS